MKARQEILWSPPQDVSHLPITKFTSYVERRLGVQFRDYAELWKWSVDDLDAFWRSVLIMLYGRPPLAAEGFQSSSSCLWDFADIKYSKTYSRIYQHDLSMPDIPKFFIGARLNYAENLLASRIHDGLDNRAALISVGEGGTPKGGKYPTLSSMTRSDHG
jgi:acetoacetyl-CoA synthetase